jgi:hypothetical protein
VAGRGRLDRPPQRCVTRPDRPPGRTDESGEHHGEPRRGYEPAQARLGADCPPSTTPPETPQRLRRVVTSARTGVPYRRISAANHLDTPVASTMPPESTPPRGARLDAPLSGAPAPARSLFTAEHRAPSHRRRAARQHPHLRPAWYRARPCSPRSIAVDLDRPVVISAPARPEPPCPRASRGWSSLPAAGCNEARGRTRSAI